MTAPEPRAALDLRQVDELVANHVFKLKPCTFRPTAQFSGWATAWACTHESSSGCYPLNADAIDHPHSILPHYTTSWDAAGLVVASWEGDVHIGRQNGQWWVELCRPSEEFKAWAETFPLAVSLAALKALGVEVPQ